jgi:hypothetical protein
VPIPPKGVAKAEPAMEEGGASEGLQVEGGDVTMAEAVPKVEGAVSQVVGDAVAKVEESEVVPVAQVAADEGAAEGIVVDGEATPIVEVLDYYLEPREIRWEDVDLETKVCPRSRRVRDCS